MRWAIAAFVAQYTDSVGRATNPACELRLMIRPNPWPIIARPAAWLAKKVPLTLTSNVRS